MTPDLAAWGAVLVVLIVVLYIFRVDSRAGRTRRR
jgi:hypothetical protein